MFFARGALGAGYVGLKNDDSAGELTIDHVGMYWDLAAGVTVWRDLAVHGTYFGGWAWEPDIKIDGQTLTNQHGGGKSLGIIGLGPGVTYHFQPINLYLSYSVGLGWSLLQFHDNVVGGTYGWSSAGFANELLVGKEWWIGGGMAVGAAAQAVFARVVDDGGAGATADINYNSFGGSLLFSASYR